MDTLADLVDLYLLRCEVKGKSPNTVRAYGLLMFMTRFGGRRPGVV